MKPSTREEAVALDAVLGDQAQRPWWRHTTPWLVLAALVAALAAIGWWNDSRQQARAPRYVTTPLARGNLAVSVTANGTLQPTRSVAIGSELSGTVARVLVDVNDRVQRGQLLVELDTAKLQDALAAARADLAAAEARQRQSAATVTEARAALGRLDELARLSGGRLPSKAELDAARATQARALADQGSAQAAVTQARANASTAQTNLGKAAIRSPIDGVVLSRAVEPGYAVAASLQAVTLFTLAEDLARLRLSVNVDEADVGQVRAGQSAAFTVAAQPGRRYPATVTRVAFGSTTTDNVVTYTTLLDVANADLSLRPGMTATATIAAQERQAVWLVPNSALRFTPGSAAAAAGAARDGGGIIGKLLPRPPGATARRGGTAEPRNGGSEARLWVLRDGEPVALRVHRGLSDGRQTEVSGDGLAAGLPVITDQTTNGSP
ncbi:efflux RND transporter periplasmic adaptor subunit [Aquincola sp. S2]|uniref:Efflux RND transporter periplasmic adaptor subunit n=1 Tax=Pseudaquabacterium terrae TaxID=2732868 RepID=A0ABX2EH97_9BURK|nr:efflux RND transporter periplasmic adaptor subunit [Aquabacterium terrae]NRF67994.1 efflux RND transporter periplasmic adaptor subunit [Aquabacterium terrae]